MEPGDMPISVEVARHRDLPGDAGEITEACFIVGDDPDDMSLAVDVGVGDMIVALTVDVVGTIELQVFHVSRTADDFDRKLPDHGTVLRWQYRAGPEPPSPADDPEGKGGDRDHDLLPQRQLPRPPARAG